MEHGMSTYIDNDNYHLELCEAGGFVFLHMEMKHWSVRTLQELRSSVEQFMKDQRAKGYDLVFATTDNEKTLKFWQMIKPCDVITKFGDEEQYIMGTWKTKGG